MLCRSPDMAHSQHDTYNATHTMSPTLFSESTTSSSASPAGSCASTLRVRCSKFVSCARAAKSSGTEQPSKSSLVSEVSSPSLLLLVQLTMAFRDINSAMSGGYWGKSEGEGPWRRLNPVDVSGGGGGNSGAVRLKGRV